MNTEEAAKLYILYLVVLNKPSKRNKSYDFTHAFIDRNWEFMLLEKVMVF